MSLFRYSKLGYKDATYEVIRDHLENRAMGHISADCTKEKVTEQVYIFLCPSNECEDIVWSRRA